MKTRSPSDERRHWTSSARTSSAYDGRRQFLRAFCFYGTLGSISKFFEENSYLFCFLLFVYVYFITSPNHRIQYHPILASIEKMLIGNYCVLCTANPDRLLDKITIIKFIKWIISVVPSSFCFALQICYKYELTLFNNAD